MVNEVTIRPAGQGDIAAMAELLSTLFAMEEDFSVDADKQRAGLEMFFQYPDGRYLVVAEKPQQVVGMCSAQLLISTAEGGWKAIIEDVVVAKQLRGQGIGKRMLAELADWAAQQGASRKDLLADRDNIDGLKFYDRLNWRRTNLIALQLKGI